MPTLDDYLTVAEAADETGVQYKTLLARINNGKVKAERKGTRLFLIHRDEVERIKKQEKRGS